MSNRVLTDKDENGVITLRLNRPEAHNAIDNDTIDEMTATFAQINSSPSIRALVLRGGAETFCSGVDIAWMQHMAKSGNGDDARRVAHLFLALRNLSKPTLAVLEGPCLGGGVAVAACCDVAIATEEVYFSLPAVQIGTVPAVVAPFIMEAIGFNQARRYFLTGESFSAEEAKSMGLIHAVCMPALLEETVEGMIGNILKGAPKTQASTKEMLIDYTGKPITPSLVNDIASRVVENRRNAEAKEGLAAFLEKRLPSWIKKPE